MRKGLSSSVQVSYMTRLRELCNRYRKENRVELVTPPVSLCLSLFLLYFVFCFWSSNTICGFSGCIEAALSNMNDVKEGI